MESTDPPPNPQFVYDEETREVQLEHGDTSPTVYTDVSEAEFELIEAVDEIGNECAALIEATVPDPDVLQNISVDRISSLQERAIECYEDCMEYKRKAEDHDSEVVSAQLKMLYKIKKTLEHYFRILSVAQSLAFSQALCFTYLQNERHLDLYVFVRNVCTTTEYLGAMIINRSGEGSVDVSDSSENWTGVYETLKEQGLGEPLIEDEDVEVTIPPSGRKEPLEELPLSASQMNYLNDKRNDIVHHCPLFVPEDDRDVLPEDLISNRIMTKKDLFALCEYATRLHLHTNLMFIDYVRSYLETLVEEFAELVYLEEE